MARRQISEERQAAYYLGGTLIVIGFLLFFSVFVSGAMNFGKFDNFEADARSSMFRAFGGMVLIIIGAVIQGIGRRGLAGSGVVLDPEKAREDMEPWSRMTGGMVKDAADEAGVNLGQALGGHHDDPDMPFDEKLRRLHQLHLDGIITDEEYEAEKKKILDQG